MEGMYMWGKLQRVFPLSFCRPPTQFHFLVGRIFSCILQKICRLISMDENPFEKKIEFPVIQWKGSRDEHFPLSLIQHSCFLLVVQHGIYIYIFYIDITYIIYEYLPWLKLMRCSNIIA